MKATYRTANGRLSFEVQSETPKDLFAAVAGLQEVFEAESACGCCDGTALKFQVRNHDDNDYHELVCLNPQCRAKFAFGQHKKGGGLFPKRKDKDGNWLPNRGWQRWTKQAQQAAVQSDPGYPEDESVPF